MTHFKSIFLKKNVIFSMPACQSHDQAKIRVFGKTKEKIICDDYIDSFFVGIDPLKDKKCNRASCVCTHFIYNHAKV